jgi:hypothetical protein
VLVESEASTKSPASIADDATRAHELMQVSALPSANRAALRGVTEASAQRQVSYRHVAGGGLCDAHMAPLRRGLNVPKLVQKVSSPI